MLHLEIVNEEYWNYVLTELITKLNKQGVAPDELKYSQSRIEEVLNVFLEYGQMPLNGALQNIQVQNLVKLIEYDY